MGDYQTLIRTLRVRTLVIMAIITVILGFTLVLNLGTEFVSTNSDAVIGLGVLYTVAISAFIIIYRQNNPHPPQQLQLQPPPPPDYRNLKIFAKSIPPVLALGFFVAIDDPLKAIKNTSVPAICLCCYIHILVILATLRRRDDYGITDGCIAASYGLLYTNTDSFWIRFTLILPVILLIGLRNLQFDIPVEQPHILQHLNHQLVQQLDEALMQRNLATQQLNNLRHRMNQASKRPSHHGRRSSVV